MSDSRTSQGASEFRRPASALRTLASIKWLAVAGCLLVACCLPLVLDPYKLTIATVIVLAIPGAVALNLVTGVAGQVSAGNPAFMALAGIVCAYCIRAWSDAPALGVIVAAGVVAAIVGAVVGLAALRLSGLYLLISTFALFYIAVYALYLYQTHAVGEFGFEMRPPSLFGVTIESLNEWYFTLLIVAVLSLLVMANILRTDVGRSWIAVRDADLAAQIIGVNVLRAKVNAFVLSSFIIGVQGAFFAYFNGSIQSETYTFHIAIQYVAMIIIGGLGLTFGSALGAIIVIGLPFALQALQHRVPTSAPGGQLLQEHLFDLNNIGYGVLIIVFVLFAPRGLADILERTVRNWIARFTTAS